MRVETGEDRADVVITDAVKVMGMIAGTTTVDKGGELHLYGMCLKGVTVKPGGRALLYGTVKGNVINEGGYMEVHGKVLGYVRTFSGETKVAVDAYINEAGE